MADITSRYQGNVSNEGQANWRGDQVTAVPGNQSIYESSTVPLADLGVRKVVGDRVFRYARAKGAISAGMVCQYGGEVLTVVPTTASGNKADTNVFTITAATAIALNTYAEGYLTCGLGATDGNLGMTYKIKSNALGSSAGSCVLTLYDPLKAIVQNTSTWYVSQCMYLNVDTSTANQTPLGVAPIAVTTGDYFWLQTWGPAPVKGTGAVGEALVSSVSGLGTRITATSTAQMSIGAPMIALAAGTNYGLTFLTIAP